MKSIKDSSRVGPFSGLIAVLLILQFITLLVPVGALEPKMDIHIEKLHASFIGEQADDMAGISVAMAGDVNGDGYGDILIGASDNDENGDTCGQVYLILGGRTGWNQDVDLSNADASWWGEKNGDYAGFSVAGAGDINGDGFDDILIGAFGNDEYADMNGQAYIIFGKNAGWQMDIPLDKADASILGTDTAERFGYSVAGVGDVNGDGFDDMLFGAPGNDNMGNDAGRAYLFFGKADGWTMDMKDGNADAAFYGYVTNDNAGTSVAGAGDVNKDGYDDIIIGSPFNDDNGAEAGAAYINFGKISGWAMDTNLKSSDARLLGEWKDDRVGYSVAGAGDVNGDGYADVIIGGFFSSCSGTKSGAGQTFLVLGKSTGWTNPQILDTADASFLGEKDGDLSGSAVSTAGDVNSDGYDDFLIGATNNDDSGAEAGQAYLVLGKATGWALDVDLGLASYASFQGQADNSYVGYSVSGGSDVNGDGISDILIGSTFKQGKTYLMLTFSAPPTPARLIASNSQDGSTITLNWKTPADSWNEPFTGYRIYRSMDGTNYKHIATNAIDNRAYADQDIINGRTYYYAIVTVDGTGALSDMSEGVSIISDVDTDTDGLGDGVDPDDDNDGVPDFSDAFPLDATETIDTDFDGTGNNKDKDDDNDGILDTFDVEPLNPLNGIQHEIESINSTVKKVNTNLTKLKTTIASVDGNITALAQDLTDMETTLTGLLTSVEAQMTALSSDFAGLNDSVREQLEDLQSQLQDVNASLQKEITSVATELHAFRTATATSLQQIKDMLGRHDKNLTKEISGLNKTLQNLEKTSLEQITTQLDEIQDALAKLGINDTELMTKITEVKSDVGSFRTSTNGKLTNITTDLGKLDTIQSSINDLKKNQKNTNSKVEAAGSNNMVLMALVALVIVLVIVSIVAGMKSHPKASIPDDTKDDTKASPKKK
jgi:predicted  nucleic acid-binding Zn-ribbon protein